MVSRPKKQGRELGGEHGSGGKEIGANLNNDFKIEVLNFLVQLIICTYPTYIMFKN
jgi:hypothetical protein